VVSRARLSLGVLFSWQKFQSVWLPYGAVPTASTILWSTLDPAPSSGSLHHPLCPALTRSWQWVGHFQIMTLPGCSSPAPHYRLRQP
jgi:hypothetical protein